MEIISAPPLPLTAPGATRLASEAKVKVSLPDVPSIQAAKNALVFPAASEAFAVNV
jgi:hypothetical protein